MGWLPLLSGRRTAAGILGALSVELKTIVHPTVEIGGIKLPVGRHLSRHVRSFMFRGSYELEDQDILRTALAGDDVVMELGTGLGFVACLCAKRIGSSRVFTYEANPALEPYIRHAFRLNGVDPALEMCMLAREGGERTFYIESNFWDSGLSPVSDNGIPVRVPVRPIGAEIARIRPSLLLMDIEGGELEG
jgi:FkbM family methyltransferase